MGDAADTGGLRSWQFAALRVLGIQALIAAGYSLRPRRAPAGTDAGTECGLAGKRP